ncbi:MAG: hypothetical protein IJI61_02805 [Oscillospiraceae bacterium]|nr:hypothetical protein [Oscillospiraceae bacterium]
MDLARQVSIKVLFMENGLAAETAPSALFFTRPQQLCSREFIRSVLSC